jgi:2-amino-4-hydroxy-6-hydroxymethyldihydropteridine diphosphokinase
MWPAGWQWPEYRLEVDDITWAVDEIASALDAMRCPLTPVTDDGNWWVD